MRTLGDAMSNNNHTLGLKLTLLCLLCLSFAGQVLAESADRDKPIDLEADTVKVDDAKQISTYSGNVILTQGSLIIRADKLIFARILQAFNTAPLSATQRLSNKSVRVKMNTWKVALCVLNTMAVWTRCSYTPKPG